MKRNLIQAVALSVVFVAFSLSTSGLFAQATAFTYQGLLRVAQDSANGSYDVQFELYDKDVGGAQLGPLQNFNGVAVSNGLFTVTLDFGDQFPGADRWLQISVRSNGGGGFSTLAPRQSITSAPYAVRAASTQMADAVPASGIGPGTAAINISGNAATATSAAVAATAATAFVAVNAGTATNLVGMVPDSLLSTNIARRDATNVFLLPQIIQATTNQGYSLSADAGGFYLKKITGGTTMTYLSLNASSGDMRVGNSGAITTRGNGSVAVDGAFTLEAANVVADFSANDATCVFFCNTTSGNITITLPDPAGRSGRIYIVKKTSANNTLTLDASVGTIDGFASINMVANNSYRIVMSNGLNWYIIGQ
jgi:hypothetical protein